jgi:hypothetical protein|tara:strand:- start:201 stop:983 length:783 start_codon:yes stop_codon:yes gene_type:complete
MGIFKNITKTLKQAAPVIGSAIGMYIGGPAGYAALGGALGGGIGSLVGGGDTDDALTAALLGGIGGYTAQGSFNTATAIPPGRVPVTRASADAAKGIDSASAVTQSIPKYVPPKDPGIFSKIGDFASSPTGIASLGLGALALGGEEEKQTKGLKGPDPVGRSRLGIGLVGNKSYNLDDEDERNEYFEDLRKQQGVTPTKFVADGGEITGPGTGTSDSVPARLSDGEFVLTAKSVRGAGGGDRDLGAARMYDMMSKLERVA